MCKEYQKMALGAEGKQFKMIGQFCPNPARDYILKDLMELKDTEEEAE